MKFGMKIDPGRLAGYAAAGKKHIAILFISAGILSALIVFVSSYLADRDIEIYCNKSIIDASRESILDKVFDDCIEWSDCPKISEIGLRIRVSTDIDRLVRDDVFHNKLDYKSSYETILGLQHQIDRIDDLQVGVLKRKFFNDVEDCIKLFDGSPIDDPDRLPVTQSNCKFMKKAIARGIYNFARHKKATAQKTMDSDDALKFLKTIRYMDYLFYNQKFLEELREVGEALSFLVSLEALGPCAGMVGQENCSEYLNNASSRLTGLINNWGSENDQIEKELHSQMASVWGKILIFVIVASLGLMRVSVGGWTFLTSPPLE